MAKPLQRLNLEEGLIQTLNSSGYHKVKDVLLSSPLQLMENLNLPLAACHDLLADVAQQSAPTAQTALQTHMALQDHCQYLPTGLEELDKALGGGVRCGSLTELVGPAGIGKSQMCFMLVLSALILPAQSEGDVLFIDTERKFSSQRLLQIAQARQPGVILTQTMKETLLKRVHIITANTPNDLLNRLKDLEAAVVEKSVRLILIDSIALLARADPSASVTDRQMLLGQQASILKRIAQVFGLPVVMTNQVAGQGPAASMESVGGTDAETASNDWSGLGAALGILFAHAINTRLVLEMSGDRRHVRIAKSPAAPCVGFEYGIGLSGIQLLQPPAQPLAAGGNALRDISHTMTYQPQ